MRTQSGMMYETFGAGGRPIVVCTCWFEAPQTVRSLDTHWLRRLAEDQMLVVTNRRGLAGSAGFSNLDNEVMGLREVVDELGAPAVVLGGCEASAAPIALAAEYPDIVRALIIVNGSPRWAADGDYPGSPPERLRSSLNRIREDWEQFFYSLFAEVAPIPWTDLDSAFGVFRQFVTADALAVFMENFLLADVRTELSRITAPTLVIHSTENEVIPFPQAQYIAAHVSGGRLHPLKGARHHIDPTHNDEVADTVKGFLDELN